MLTRFCILALAALYLALAVPALARPSVQLSGSTFASDPSAISAVVPLGEQRTVTVALSNRAAVAVVPQLFEAWPTPPITQGGAGTAPPQVALPAQAGRVDPQIARDLAANGGRAQVVVFLAEQADLAPAYAIEDWTARGNYVYETLRDHAARYQTALRGWLAAHTMAYEPLWAVNALLVEADATDVAELAARADVALLRANRAIVAVNQAALHESALRQVTSPCQNEPNNICWNIRRIAAERVWSDFGVRGAGITLASIDSGVRADHPALAAAYRGRRDDGSLDHNYNWYDPRGRVSAPADAGTHGTHTMGTMVGQGGDGRPAVGVAPGARWISVRGCDAYNCYEADLIRAAQWLLAPTDNWGRNPRPDLRPHIINNSWTDNAGANDWYAGYTAAWRAAGIFPVFAAGNGSNSACSTVRSPADYANVMAVGAIGSSGRLADFSTIGPTQDGRLKPDLTAPGESIVSASANGTAAYVTMSGTSMAAPHSAGTVALLWSANPALIGDYDATYAALSTSAHPVVDDSRFADAAHTRCATASTPNNVYGYGVLDAYAAVARVKVDVPWLQLPNQALAAIAPASATSLAVTLDATRVPGPGIYQARILVYSADLGQAPFALSVTMIVPAERNHVRVSGTVRSAASGVPLVASIAVSGGARVATDAAGRYSLTLAAASTPYTLSAQALEYRAQSQELRASAATTATLDFALAPDQARLDLATEVLSATLAYGASHSLVLPFRNNGIRALTYNLVLTPQLFGIWPSDKPGGASASWIVLPVDATRVALSEEGFTSAIALGFDFPFYGNIYREIYLGSNGVLSLARPGSLAAYADSCLPLPESIGPALVPLRLDLDPSAAGARVSYAQLNEGLLVSYEDVPLRRDPARRVSFQALLRRDGSMRFNYRALPLQAEDRAAAGLQHTLYDAQEIGCGSGLATSAPRSIELRPQPSSIDWIELVQPTGRLETGQAGATTIRLRGIETAPGQILRATLQLDSNDPTQLRTEIIVFMQSTPAPHRVLLPLVFGYRTPP